MLTEQLSHVDTVFMSVEKSNTPMHTAGVVIFEGELPFQAVYSTIEARLGLVPRFTQRVVEVPFGLGQPFWVDDPDFDLTFHVRHAALPAPGNDEQLCDYAARLISRQLDRSKPLWEIYVIDGLEDGRSALVTKTHHAMVDGLSSMDLATVLFDFEPKPDKTSTRLRSQTSEPLPSGVDLLRRALQEQAKSWFDLGNTVGRAVSAPLKLVQNVSETASLVAKTATSMLRPAKASTLNTGPGMHRRYAIVRSTLQTFKDIKNAADATVNDVILTVCADALGRLFRHRNDPTEGKTLRVMVPVSVRDESQKMALGNEVTPIFVDLPIGKMKSLDRLEIIHEQMRDIKRSRKAVGADILVGITKWAPATLHSMAARLGVRARLFNTLVSNVPGPQMPLYSVGVKMLEPYAVVPLVRGQSLAIGVTSYNAGIFFGLNADRDSHPDLQYLARFIDDSIVELEKAAAEGSSEEITHAETQVAVGKEGST